MTIERPMIGEPIKHNGHLITIHHLGPDLLVRVDGVELSAFYTSTTAARAGGMRYADELDREKAKAN